jgi:hypothetical protein
MAEESPPLSEHGISKDEREFLYEVGNAITQWAKIDERLFSICAAILRADKQHVALIYYRHNSLGGRLRLVDDLVKTILPPNADPKRNPDPPVTAAWKAVVIGITNSLSVRNQLAHSPSGPQVEVKDRPDGTFAITDIWWASYVSATDKLRDVAASKPDLRIDEVKSHVHSVGQIWMSLRDFEHTALPALLAK